MALTDAEIKALAKKICNSPEHKEIANKWADEFLDFYEKETAQVKTEQQ